MIAPTARAITLAALGAPIAIAASVLLPGPAWMLGVLWAGAAAALFALDGVLASHPARLTATLDAPSAWPIASGPLKARLSLAFKDRAPPRLEAALETNDLAAVSLDMRRAGDEDGAVDFTLTPLRRGALELPIAHVRWDGPLGLAARVTRKPLSRQIAITPDLDAVKRRAASLFSRTNIVGAKALRERGDGSEFDALSEFQAGMDRRLIAWKHSARHAKLLAKEVRIERNHQVALAIDCGRAMCEPLEDAPRLDWSINAALVLGYVALKYGDRVSCYGFDARPRHASGFVSGARGFAQLQKETAAFEYSDEESNYTLGLTQLAERLQRRSLVVVFTEFTDTVSAELMLENIGRLARKHLLMFVAFADAELEQMLAAQPDQPGDVARAVLAQSMLQERELVLERLRRKGAHIVTSTPQNLSENLIAAYDHIRRRELL